MKLVRRRGDGARASGCQAALSLCVGVWFVCGHGPVGGQAFVANSFTPGTLRINCGGLALNDSFYRPWGADRFFNGGNNETVPTDGLYSVNSTSDGAGTAFLYDFVEKYELIVSSDGNVPLMSTLRTFSNIVHGNSSYVISISGSDLYAVRLYFAELTYVNPALRQFNVSINGFTVLDDYNVLNQPYIFSLEEFSYPCNTTVIEIKFTSILGNPYVNAIEVVPLPANQYRQELPASVGPVVLQQISRYVMGVQDDSVDGQGRIWKSDNPDFYTNPNTNVSTYNGTAIRKVGIPPQEYGAFIYHQARIITPDNSLTSGLSLPINTNEIGVHLIILHFVELEYSSIGDRILDIKLQGEVVKAGLDVLAEAGGPYVAFFLSFLVDTTEVSNGINLEILPNSTSKYSSPMLSGLEVFLVQYETSQVPPGTTSKLSGGAIAGIIVGAVIAFAVVLALLFLWWFQGHVERKYWAEQGPGGPVLRELQKRQVRFCTLKEINYATNKLSDANKLGAGGFGTVYKGEVHGIPWAVKRANKASHTSLPDFTNEVDLISQLNHVNLVRLIGFCTEKGEQIFVYEFCHQGSISDHLRPRKGHSKIPLSFKQRLDIALGSARGLNYLHSFAEEPVIHRDIKSDNILLDHDFTAKVADFGLLKKIEAEPARQKTVKIAGTHGYLDPEYYATFQVTEKSDVYSFGVVLLELLTGRMSVLLNRENPDDTRTLVAWCRPLVSAGCYQEMADPNLGPFPVEVFQKVCDLALACCKQHGHQRPPMAFVVRQLENLYFGEDALSDNASMSSAQGEQTPLLESSNGWQGSQQGSAASAGGSVQMTNVTQAFSMVVPR